MTSVRFSVVTACFNDRENLERSAKSILGQEGADFEWIVVDGASKDGVRDYLQELGDPRLRWISEPDRGIYDAFNKGVALSNGDYIVFIGAGDLFCGSDTLRNVSAFIDKHPDQMLYYGDAFEINSSGSAYLRKARRHEKIWWNLFTHHQSIFYSRKNFESVSYDKSYRVSGDYALTAELLNSGVSAIQMPFPTSQFLLGGTSQKNYWLGERENLICRIKLGTSLIRCSAIYSAHAVIRFGRVATPGIYRALRYTSNGSANPVANHA